MTRLFLTLGLLSVTACVQAIPSGGGGTSARPVHPDPLCFYDYDVPAGDPPLEVCA